jgi:hypothetical protein
MLSLLYILGLVIVVSSLRTVIAGNRSGYQCAKRVDLGEKAEKMVLPGRAAFLLTTIYDNSSDWREARNSAISFVESVSNINSELTIDFSLPK